MMVKGVGGFHTGTAPGACVLHFNSLRRSKPHILRRIKQYLQDEWARRKEATEGPRDFSILADVAPLCPQQRNLHDCGVFTLEYLERLLLTEAPLPTFDELSAATPDVRRKFFSDRRGWFSQRDVESKREDIRRLICCGP